MNQSSLLTHNREEMPVFDRDIITIRTRSTVMRQNSCRLFKKCTEIEIVISRIIFGNRERGCTPKLLCTSPSYRKRSFYPSIIWENQLLTLLLLLHRRHIFLFLLCDQQLFTLASLAARSTSTSRGFFLLFLAFWPIDPLGIKSGREDDWVICLFKFPMDRVITNACYRLRKTETKILLLETVSLSSFPISKTRNREKNFANSVILVP